MKKTVFCFVLAITKNCQPRPQVGTHDREDAGEAVAGQSIRDHEHCLLPPPSAQQVLLYHSSAFQTKLRSLLPPVHYGPSAPCAPLPCLSVTPHPFFTFPVKSANRCRPKNGCQPRKQRPRPPPLPATPPNRDCARGLRAGPDPPRPRETRGQGLPPAPGLQVSPRLGDRAGRAAPRRAGEGCRVPAPPTPSSVAQSSALLPFPLKSEREKV